MQDLRRFPRNGKGEFGILKNGGEIKNRHVRIHWNTGGEDGHNSKYTWFNEIGREINVMPVPEKEGCIFHGWYNYDSNFPGTMEKIDRISRYDRRELRLYALWSKDGEIVDCYERIRPDYFLSPREPKKDFMCKVSYKYSKGLYSVDNFPMAFDYSQNIDLPVPVRDGFIFGGWYLIHNLKTQLPQYLEKMCKKKYNRATVFVVAKWLKEDGTTVDDCYETVKPEDFAEADEKAEGKCIEDPGNRDI